MIRWWWAPVVVGAGLVLAACHGGPHVDVTVTTTADGADASPGDGVCEMTAGAGDCSLRAAIDEVNAQPAAVVGDVAVPAGTYVLDGAPGEDLNATGDLDVRRWVNLVGTGAVVIDGGGTDRVLDVRPGGTLGLTGVTVTGGAVAGNGGGVRSLGNLAVLADSTITGNVATSKGGGVFVGSASNVQLLTSTVSGNQASLGGGVSSVSVAGFRFATVTDNVGGGVHVAGGTVTLAATAVSDQATGADCVGPDPTSQGYNVDGDASCGLAAAGDRSGRPAELGPLEVDGGATPTHLPGLASPAVDAVPVGVLGCGDPLADQRGRTRPGAFACDIGATEVQPGEHVSVTTVLSANRAWDLGFTPDGTMVYTTRPGPIRAWTGTTSKLLADPDDVVASGEGGMLGLAIDPAFATNRFLYACFNSNLGPVPEVRVVRWTVDAGYTGLSNRTDIVTGITVNPGNQPGRHSGCRPRFGPDGYLWVTTGDGAVATNPQDPNALGGKVLRVDRDGDPAPGNAGGPFRPEIYSFGHRNPQGITFRPSDGAAFSIEHGSNCDDEVNALVPGGNYGWNPVRPDGQPGYFEGVPMTDTVAFPGAVEAVWSSGCPTIAPSGGTFLSGASWGGADGALAVAVLKGMHLRLLRFAPGGTELVGETVPLTGQGRLRAAVQGPDGALYVIRDASPGPILRVAPVP